MDSLNRARSAVQQVLSRYADLDSAVPAGTEVRTYCAFDTDRDQYLVVRAGWSGQRRVRGIVLHVRIADGKVWLEENGTDREIATELTALGVPAGDIVLGFVHPSLRDGPQAAVA